LLAWLLWVAVFRPLVGPFLPSFGQCEAAFAQLRSAGDVDQVRDACRARDGTTPRIVEARIVLRLEAIRLNEQCEKELAGPKKSSPECEQFFDEEERSFTEQQMIERADRVQRAAR
jgi:hypothetical protein